jgi:molybdopterin biosynthesis enzyme
MLFNSVLITILRLDADIFVPSFDNSAMDGYALNLKAEQINISGGTTFKITDRTAIFAHFFFPKRRLYF